jgi:GT2 family glycosyltransferase
MARSLGAQVVELDTTHGFTAARARNAGFARLMQLHPQLTFVQFIDGDCEVDPAWLSTAAQTLDTRPDLAVVCGRRRERSPDATIYNRLCDLEWDTTPGETTECGGDAMMRINAFEAVGGYNSRLIAGEEPELCVRFRAAGWKILRLPVEMTLHDAAMTRFSQWWNRNLRAGHAFAEGASMHGNSPVKHWVRQTRSNWLWGLAMPLVMLALAWPTRALSLALMAALYVLLVTKVYLNAIHRGRSRPQAALFAVFCVLSKLPQAFGQLKYHLARLLGRKSVLIEYKISPA